MCNKCHFPLRKWSSNSEEVLNSIPVELRGTKTLVSLEESQESIKTLGVQWNPREDMYHFIINLPSVSAKPLTKRQVLSEVSMIFDPLGWLSPVIVTAKILLQTIWKSKVEWDEDLPTHLQQQWGQLKHAMKSIETITIPRCIIPGTPIKTVLCGFCDASTVAYSAVLYSLCVYSDFTHKAFLITSKTKVAPVASVTLPRLELCSAVLLSSLAKSTIKAIKYKFDDIHCYTDSMISLAWINSCPTRWRTFVKHRVHKIQSNLPTAIWAHVPGESNPADCASRGITPEELLCHPLWWHGNELMTVTPKEVQIPPDTLEPVRHEEQPVKVHLIVKEDDDIISRFSSFPILLRVTCRIIRLAFNARNSPEARSKGPLTVQDLRKAENVLLKLAQAQMFPIEIASLKNRKQLHSSSKILSLTPFLDNDGVLRVGGRLQNASISENRKHPALLTSSHHLTKIIIRYFHLKYFHAGPSLLLALLSSQYWIVRAKDSIRREVNNCTRCIRHRAETMKQLMGNFPVDRVTPSHPFSKCGVDYCGPFITKPPVRSRITIKSYLSLFVCFATRAVHIEVVQSLSTESFIAALRRFISTRGRPSDMYSDCGTNFIGANKVLKELFQRFGSNEHNEAVANACSNDGIQWHFNPPGSPHFGGLWEAGVRSVKHHLQRVMGETRYTYEELLTLVKQIEALLNSRPLVPVSSDPTDLQALTPAHFLNGKATTLLPEMDYSNINDGRITQWQRLQKQQQLFWKRWSSEYISRLQQRPKWMRQSRGINVNDMVIMKDENLPPAKWQLGRIVEVYPGGDGIVRVVKLRTAQGQFKRAIHRLCLLPIERPAQEVSVEEVI